MVNSDKKDLIDLYINGMLTGAELENFIQTMKSDSELETEVLLHTDIRIALCDKDSLKLRDTLDAIHKKHKKSIGKQEQKGLLIRLVAQKWARVAAGFALLAGVSTMLWFMLRPSFNERIYSAYYKPYDASAIVRSGTPQTTDLFSSALLAYDSSNYEHSWKLLKDLSIIDQNNMPAFFFRGVAAMELNKFDDAEFSFKKIINDNNSLYVENAEWYLALCYIKNNDKVLAKSLLTKIVEKNGYYKADAEKILEELIDL